MRKGFVGDAAALFVVLLVAQSVRVWFAAHVASTHNNKPLSLMHGDTREYVHLGENLARRGQYVDFASTFSRFRGVVRPPGYPLVYAGALAAGVDVFHRLAWLSWIHLPFTLGATACVFVVARVMFRSRRWATLASTMSALSPTGIAINAMPLADAMFGSLCAASLAAAVLMLAAKNRCACVVAACAAGICTAAALLFKPAAMPTLVAWVAVALLTRRLRPMRWAIVAALCLPSLAWYGAWSIRNLRTEGIFTYTTIADRNLLYLVVPEVQLRSERSRSPTRAEITRRFNRYAGEQEKFVFHTSDASVKRLHGMQSLIIRETLLGHPLITARVHLSNLKNQLLARYKNINQQFPKHDPVSTAVKNVYDRTDAPWIAWTWLLAIVAAPLLVLAHGGGGDAIRRRPVCLLAGHLRPAGDGTR